MPFLSGKCENPLQPRAFQVWGCLLLRQEMVGRERRGWVLPAGEGDRPASPRAVSLAGVHSSSGSPAVAPGSSQLNAERFQHLPGLPSWSLRFLTTASLGIQLSVTGESGNFQRPPQLQGKLTAVQKHANLRCWNEPVIVSLAWK